MKDSSLTRVQPLFGAALRRDPTGASWLPRLLAAAPRGRRLLGPLVDQPGTLGATTVEPSHSKKAALRCFEVQVPPDRRFLSWCIEHPDKLTSPPDSDSPSPTVTKRRSLIVGAPPGARASLQQEARKQVAAGSIGQTAWWRFERATEIDCVLATDRLVLCIEGKRCETLSPNTQWLSGRHQVARNLEAASRVAGVGRQFAVLVCVEKLGDPLADPDIVQASLQTASPHLFAAERQTLADAYLGAMTWVGVCTALGVDPGDLPDTVADL